MSLTKETRGDIAFGLLKHLLEDRTPLVHHFRRQSEELSNKLGVPLTTFNWCLDELGIDEEEDIPDSPSRKISRGWFEEDETLP